MYKIHTDLTQVRTSKLPQDSKKTNKSVSFSTGVILTTSVSRPQLKSNPKGDRVLRSNSHGKKLDVEEHRRNVKLLKNKMSVTACTDNLNVKTVNETPASAMCANSVMIKKHDLRVPKSVAKPLRKPVASESIKKPRNNVRKLHERFGKTYKWTYIKFTPSGPNGKVLKKCILSGPYKPTTILVQAVEATDDSPAVPEHTTVETATNMSPENKTHFLAEKEAIHLILTGIGDDIYSTVDACQTAQEMFVTIVKQQHKLDEVSYHKLFDILKQYQNEVNELRAEKLARNANLLALVATAQASQDQYYQSSRSHRSSAPSPKPLIPSRSHTTTRHKGKDIAKPITPPSETAFEEDIDPEHAQRDKDMQNNLAIIVKYFRKIYKPTNNNLRTSSNFKNKNVDTTPWFRNDNQEYGHFAKECKKPKRVKDSAYHKEKMLLCKQAEQGEVPTADSGTDSEPVELVQNDAGYNVFANMLQHFEQSESVSITCLVETDDSNVIPDSPDMYEDDIQNDQNDVESDDERVALADLIANLKLDVDENKKIQTQLKKANTTLAQELKEYKTILVKTSKSLGESISVRDSCLVALQTKQAEFEKFKAFNDHTVDYDKLERKLNEALGQLAHKDTIIREGLKMKVYELSMVKEKHDEFMKHSLLTKSHYEGLVKQKMKVITDLKLTEEHDIEKMLSMEKQLKFLNEVVYKRSQSIQTIHMMASKVATYNGRPTFAYPRYLKQAQSEISCLYVFPYDQSTHANRLIPDGEETLALKRESRSKLNKDSVRPYDYTKLNSLYEICKPPTQDELKKLIEKGKGKSVDTKFDRPSVVQQPNAQRIPKPSVLGKLTPFSNSLERIYFPKTRSVPKTNVSEGLSKPVNAQTLPQTAKKAFTPILGYGDLVQGNVTINSVYYIKGLNHNLISVGQFCDADLEVAFRKSTCFVRDLQGHTNSSMVMKSKAFSSKLRLHQLAFKKGYRDCSAKVITVRTDRGTKFLNKTLNAFFKEEGIEHQNSTARTPEQNGVFKRRNRTLVEAARTMLSALQL
nr:integrase, catalytic region, zinc finger, CCHC-type, peptidase aspartic, catalytic [Tanacetum cinerariifolium]